VSVGRAHLTNPRRTSVRSALLLVLLAVFTALGLGASSTAAAMDDLPSEPHMIAATAWTGAGPLRPYPVEEETGSVPELP
jgi:hypothetical protein